MKQTIFPLIAVLLLFFSISCTDSDEDNVGPENPGTTNEELFLGTLTVSQPDSSTYLLHNVTISVDTTNLNQKMDMVMYQVSFSPKMPMKLDISIRNISFDINQGALVLSADTIVPYTMGGAFTKYTITDLNGMMVDDSIQVAMNCGSLPITFEGIRK